MDQTEGSPSENGTTVSPTAGNLGTPGSQSTAKEAAEGTAEASVKEAPADGAGQPCRAASESGEPGARPQDADVLDELKGEAGKKEETKPAPSEVKGKEEAAMASEKRDADGKEANVDSKEELDVDDEAKPEPKEGVGSEVTVKEAEAESQKKAGVEVQASAELQADGGKETEGDTEEQVEPGSPTEEQEQAKEEESEERAAVIPSSPEEWPESPTDEGASFSPDGLGPDSTGETSPSVSDSSPSDVPQSPTEPPPAEEKKERAPERRVSAPTRPRGPRAQNRKAILDKFGGAASGPTALFRNTKAAGAAIGGVKNMLLEWCRAMTRNYEHVDIQNFSSSWSSGMAFCALIHKFFPDAFDYAELDPTKRRHNFTLAFSTAEKRADCAQLLEVDDMVRLAVPDSKCVYTYIQELYRSLVQKGLVKTKKK
ncbi:smoothelin-like protein 1 isoform X2 [Mesocricetus auratus]|uniref:Smoothelin-like protein 1 isoform X2 n=1 Tax=Mesocricetus auratus TaxID=10036 RepID=A0ABM2XFV5_MESAU|nr:smoothelin-like protein 1 isoform X2 [Mesocricetus auratus]